MKTPRKFQFGKKSAKVYHCLYSSTEQLQVALWTYMLLKFGLSHEKSIHTLPLRSVPFNISPSLSLPLQTLRLVSLISLISKTKRIAERSATNCDTHTHTHTHSHTDRQSTLGKYMVNEFCSRNRGTPTTKNKHRLYHCKKKELRTSKLPTCDGFYSLITPLWPLFGWINKLNNTVMSAVLKLLQSPAIHEHNATWAQWAGSNSHGQVKGFLAPNCDRRSI